jgi:hypothetical protein
MNHNKAAQYEDWAGGMGKCHLKLVKITAESHQFLIGF